MKMFISFYLAAIFIISCLILGLSSEKTFAENNIRYWICGKCGMKTKTLKDYVPVDEVRIGGNPYEILNRGRVIHVHKWREVDENTYYRW